MTKPETKHKKTNLVDLLQVLISSSGLTPDYQWTRLGHYSYIGDLEGKASYR